MKNNNIQYRRAFYTEQELKNYFTVQTREEIEFILKTKYHFDNLIYNFFKYLEDKHEYICWYRKGEPIIITEEVEVIPYSGFNIETSIMERADGNFSIAFGPGDNHIKELFENA